MSSDKYQMRQIGRRELFDRIWSKPMTANAADLGTNTHILSGLAKRLGLPLPRAGHWMKANAGKAPPTPEYPADQKLDTGRHAVEASGVRWPRKTTEPDQAVEAPPNAPHQSTAGPKPELAFPSVTSTAAEHKKVARTRSAIAKRRSADRVSIGGGGKFRLLVTPAAGGRACEILDRIVAAVEEKGWRLADTDQGFAIDSGGEKIGFMIEEQLDRSAHVLTPAEIRGKADYDRQCEEADRGIGYRPWRAPLIPRHDFAPNGDLTVKFDHDYAAGGTRRTFSDGKRQRLEDAIPSIIDALELRSASVRATRDKRDQWERDYEEGQRRRKNRERDARIDGYRITFLQRQIERQREIDDLTSLIATWEQTREVDRDFDELLGFARLHRTRLQSMIAPAAISERIRTLKLMCEDVPIHDEKMLD